MNIGDQVRLRTGADGKPYVTKSAILSVGDNALLSQDTDGKLVVHKSEYIRTPNDTALIVQGKDKYYGLMSSPDRCMIFQHRFAVVINSETDVSPVNADPDNVILYSGVHACGYKYSGIVTWFFSLPSDHSTTTFIRVAIEYRQCNKTGNTAYIESYSISEDDNEDLYDDTLSVTVWFDDSKTSIPHWVKINESSDDDLLPYKKTEIEFIETREGSYYLGDCCKHCRDCRCMRYINYDSTDTCAEIQNNYPQEYLETTDIPFIETHTEELTIDLTKTPNGWFEGPNWTPITAPPTNNFITPCGDLCLDINFTKNGVSYGFYAGYYTQTVVFQTGDSNYVHIVLNSWWGYESEHTLALDRYRPWCEFVIPKLGINLAQQFDWADDDGYVIPAQLCQYGNKEIFYHGEPLGDITVYVLFGAVEAYAGGYGQLKYSCYKMGSFLPNLINFISNSYITKDPDNIFTFTVNTWFYVQCGEIKIYKAYTDEDGIIILKTSDPVFEYIRVEGFVFTTDDNSSEWPEKDDIEFEIGEAGVYRLEITLTNDLGSDNPQFLGYSNTVGSISKPVEQFIYILPDPIIAMTCKNVSVRKDSNVTARLDFTVTSNCITDNYKWTLKHITDPVFSDESGDEITLTSVKGGIYDLRYAGTYSVKLLVNIDTELEQTIEFSDIIIVVPDPADTLKIEVGNPNSEGTRRVTFTFGTDYYRTGIELNYVLNTFSFIQESHAEIPDPIKNVEFPKSDIPYIISYTVSNPVSTKTYVHELNI